jgi:hypothetical protein
MVIPKPTFPWLSLSLLMLGCLPFGLLLGLGNGNVLTLALTLALALALTRTRMAGAATAATAAALTWFLALALALAWFLALALAWIGLLALGGPLAWFLALTWFVAGTLALAGALAAVNANAWVGAWVIGALLIGAITGYFSEIGIWAGLGAGFWAIFQVFTLIGGISLSNESLNPYRPFNKFMVWGTVSCLGLAIGGGLGWWLYQAGIRLPT